jgi:hypothetical protein
MPDSWLRRLRHRLVHLLGWAGGDVDSRWAEDGSGGLIIFWRCLTCGMEKGHFAVAPQELATQWDDPADV